MELQVGNWWGQALTMVDIVEWKWFNLFNHSIDVNHFNIVKTPNYLPACSSMEAPMGLHGAPWSSVEPPWSSTEIHGAQWSSMEPPLSSKESK